MPEWSGSSPRGDDAPTRRDQAGAAGPGRRGLPPELDPRGGAAPPRTREVRPPRAGGPAGLGGPGGPGEPYDRPVPGPGGPPPARAPRRRRRPRLLRLVLLLLVVLLLFWGALAAWGTSRLQHEQALSDRAGTPGTTWLVVGSDSREGLTAEERKALKTGKAQGRRTDTIMLLHVPDSGSATLVSLPRDSYVSITGQGRGKLNAAYALGGAPLLVSTVEGATGLTVDHFVEIGFGGVVGVVDAVGGVELCVKEAIQDEKSGLDVAAGCQQMPGSTALSYVRARYFDPTGDLGRIKRQQQFVSALVSRVASPLTLLNPVRQVRLVGAGTDALRVDESTSALDLVRLARSVRSVSGGGGTLTTVPIADPDYRVGGQSTVLWDKEEALALFADLEAGRAVQPAD